MEVQPSQVCEVCELGRDSAAQLVVVEVQPSQVSEVCELGWDSAAQLVVVEVQLSQVCEVSELGRYLSAQLILSEFNVSDSAGSVRGYAVPFARGRLLSQLVLFNQLGPLVAL